MTVAKMVHQLLQETIHKSRINSLLPVLTAVIKSKKLVLTELGRTLKTKGQERSGIRRVDRLLANPYYQQHSIDIYRCIIKCVVGTHVRPLIIVDWSSLPNSHLSAQGEHCVLRAALASEGRGLVLYEEVHPKSDEGKPYIHSEFLKRLHSLVPSECRPCLLTDGGFKNPWFKAVVALGWDYIGRTRGLTLYSEGQGFQSLKRLFDDATSTPQYIGYHSLAKTNPIKTHFYLYKLDLKGRKKRSKIGNEVRSNISKKYSDSYREPWVLVSSLSDVTAKKIIDCYKQRMTIEESFRDTKSTQYGLSLNNNKTIKPARYAVWLMLAALATFIAWVYGYSAERIQLHYHFQANTYRTRRVLSFFYLGCQIIRKRINITINLKGIQQLAWGASL